MPLTIEGAGEPVVLVPGINGAAEVFYRQRPLLAAAYRVATYSLRDKAASMADLVDDLGHVIDTVVPDGQPAIVMAESFGGAVALSFALTHPTRVRALVIVNSFSRYTRAQVALAQVGLSALPWPVMKPLRRLAAFRLHSPHTPREEVRRFMAITDRTVKRGYVNRLRILRGYDIRARLASLQVPVLFVASDRDHLVPAVAEARLMASLAPRAGVRVLPGQGHICLIAPDVDFRAILDDWLPHLP